MCKAYCRCSQCSDVGQQGRSYARSLFAPVGRRRMAQMNGLRRLTSGPSSRARSSIGSVIAILTSGLVWRKVQGVLPTLCAAALVWNYSEYWYTRSLITGAGHAGALHSCCGVILPVVMFGLSVRRRCSGRWVGELLSPTLVAA